MNYRNFHAAILAASMSLAATFAHAALDASIKVTGAKQDEFPGTSTKHKGSSDVTEFVTGLNYSIVSPRDATSGLSSGKRKHSAFKVTRVVDAMAPKFGQAIMNGELLPAVRLTVYKLVNGKETVDYTIDLTRAHVIAIERMKVKPEIEIVSFNYEKITVTWAGGKTFTDDWEARQ